MHLLVIEDDPRLVRLLRRLLEEDRHVVETAMTGLDGIDIAEATTGVRLGGGDPHADGARYGR
jgi:DNA-binding response OmpR family regulator